MLKEKKGADKRRAVAAKAKKEAAKALVIQREQCRQNPRNDYPEIESSTTKKRQEISERRAAGVARRAEARNLAKQEEEELEKNLKLKKLGKEKIKKVTEAELARTKEVEKEAMRKKIEEKNSRTTKEIEYKKMVLVENTNKDESVIDAHTIDEAISQLCIANDYMKEPKLERLFKAFGEEQLSRLKEEKPGLSDSQYTNLVWKLWKRSGYAGEKKSEISDVYKNKEERKSRGKVRVWEDV